MRHLLFAAIAAATLGLGLGTAFAAQPTNQGLSNATSANGQPPAFVYTPGGD